MPKIDTLDALNDETTSMLKTLTHSLSFSGSKRYIYIGGNKSFGAHTAESLCFQWDADLLKRWLTKIQIQYNKMTKTHGRDRGGALGKPLKLHLFGHRQLFSLNNFFRS